MARKPRPYSPKPWSAGQPIEWQQWPASMGTTTRTGTVWSYEGPVAGSCWVIPDEPRPGEGTAIAVKVNRTKGTAVVDENAPYYAVNSQAAYQRPETAPRAVIVYREVPASTGRSWGSYPTEGYSTVSIHSRPGCQPGGYRQGTAIEAEAETVGVVAGRIVPGSTIPSGVYPCGACVKAA